MLLLTSITSIIRLVTYTAANVSVNASWADNASGIFTVGSTPTTGITTATTTTVVASPAASTQRNVRNLSIVNEHVSVAADIVVEHYDGTTAIPIWEGSLGSNEKLVLDELGNWRKYDSLGILYTRGVTDEELRATDLPVAIHSLNYPNSTGNNTTAQLAAGATFIGTIETVQNLQSAQVQVVCDQPYTLTINQYIDSGGTKLTERTSYQRAKNSPLCLNVMLPGNYFNVTLTNNGIDSTIALQIDTTFGIMDTLPKTLGQKIRDESMAVTLSADDVELLSTILQALGPLQTSRDATGALRIMAAGGTISAVTTVGTVTTATTVGTVNNLTNQVNNGGYSAAPHIPSLMNIVAQNNINNMIG